MANGIEWNCMRGWSERLGGFLFPAESDSWLTTLRIGMGVQWLLYVLSLAREWKYHLWETGGGPASRDLSESVLSFDSVFIPRLGWIVAAGQTIGLSEQMILSLAWIVSFCAALFLLGGIFSRSAALAAWLLHLSAVKSGELVSYGMDNFTTIGLFYLMLSPLPDRFSLDDRLLHRRLKHPELLGFFRRILQIHLCVIYFFGGLTKSLGGGWWTGASIWRALTRPPFNLINPETLVHWKSIFPMAGIMVCLLEMGYPFLIWAPKTRKPWLIAICAMHIGIGLMMGLYLFSLVMIILNLAAFGSGTVFPQARPNEPGRRMAEGR